MNRPLVSVVIPTLNAGKSLAHLLAALRSQDLAGGIEILVIDSGSSDHTLEIARSAGAHTISVPRKSFHHSRTRNLAIEQSRGELVALTVQDALPADDRWLAHLVCPLLSDPRIGGAYGLQKAPSTASLVTRAQSAMWCEGHSQAEVRAVPSLQHFQEMLAEERLEYVRFDNVTSCIRRSVWERWPLPDLPYGEDMGWAKQVLLAGQQIALVPEAQVWHFHERGWLYELRRAYVDGLARVLLVDWPSPSLSLRTAYALLRRLLFTLRTHRYDCMTDPEAARAFILAERRYYAPAVRLGSQVAIIYDAILRFCTGLTNTATALCPSGAFPQRGWVGLLRFAAIAVIGQQLGSNSVGVSQAPAFERMAWRVLHWLLNARV